MQKVFLLGSGQNLDYVRRRRLVLKEDLLRGSDPSTFLTKFSLKNFHHNQLRNGLLLELKDKPEELNRLACHSRAGLLSILLHHLKQGIRNKSLTVADKQ